MTDTTAELLEKLPNGRPRVSEYTEWRRIMKREHTDEAFSDWLLMAVTLTKSAKGNA